MNRLERWWIVGVALGALVLAGSISVHAQNLEERVQKLEKEVGDGLPAWLDKIKFSGDLRLRYQHDDQDGAPARDRGRYRARLNVTAQIIEQIKVIFGLASGSDDPRSTNETFDGSFRARAFTSILPMPHTSR